MPDTWDDIFKKAKALGLNCIETYTVWNMHEPIVFETDGILGNPEIEFVNQPDLGKR